MDKFRNKMMDFMRNRYGADEFTKFLLITSLILLVINVIHHNTILYFIALIGIVYAYYRVLSRNYSKRHEENQKFLKLTYKIRFWKNNVIAGIKDHRVNKIFKCPGCGQKIRIPKGKGKIKIKCPKCRIEFIRKT